MQSSKDIETNVQRNFEHHLEHIGFGQYLLNVSSETGGTWNILYLKHVWDVLRQQMCLSSEAKIGLRNLNMAQETPEMEECNETTHPMQSEYVLWLC